MPNVPRHGRTRASHRTAVRATHGTDGYRDPLEDFTQVYDQIGVDEAGQVTAGQISPGAVEVAAFAAGIQPVLLVDGLPTLPDPEYPEDVIVFDISVSPRVLYKNEADVWVKLIGPDDIQANSITAGQIAAGAVSTSELAVGARLTGELANESGGSPGVFIDSSGILIRSGKLTLQDEFGLTSLQASGFAGSWSDFVRLGLYNGRFMAGQAGVVPNGRDVELPYWTVSDAAGSPVATYFTSGGIFNNPGVRVTWSAINTTKKFVSDPIRMNEFLGARHFGVYGSFARSAGGLRVRVYFEADTTSAFSSPTSSTQFDWLWSAGASDEFRVEGWMDSFEPWARLVIEVTELTTHNAANKIELHEAWLKDSPNKLGRVAWIESGGIEELVIEAESDEATLLVKQGSPTTGYGIESFAPVVVGTSAGAETAVLDESTGEFTEYSDNTWSTYTPTVGGSGGATHSTIEGYYQKIGKMVFVIIYLVCDGNGSGANDITITTPSNPSRDHRQVLLGSSTGHTIPNGPLSLTAFTGGAGAVWDRLHGNGGGAMTGADYDSGGIIVIQGFYREA